MRTVPTSPRARRSPPIACAGLDVESLASNAMGEQHDCRSCVPGSSPGGAAANERTWGVFWDASGLQNRNAGFDSAPPRHALQRVATTTCPDSGGSFGFSFRTVCGRCVVTRHGCQPRCRGCDSRRPLPRSYAMHQTASPSMRRQRRARLVSGISSVQVGMRAPIREQYSKGYFDSSSMRSPIPARVHSRACSSVGRSHNAQRAFRSRIDPTRLRTTLRTVFGRRCSKTYFEHPVRREVFGQVPCQQPGARAMPFFMRAISWISSASSKARREAVRARDWLSSSMAKRASSRRPSS